MEPHFPMQPNDPPPAFAFPTLPIVTPDPPRLSPREKYGSLLYLGLAGLAVVVALVGWFSWGVWSLRAVWSDVYTLHDARRPERERVASAFRLSRDPRVNQRQLWDMSLRKTLPPLARYVLAEALTAEAASADPRGYALSVARSEGWPDWLRLILTRPMAYAAARGVKFPREPLDELRRNPDPGVGLWATAALALMEPSGPAFGDLERACGEDGRERELACLLRDAARPGVPPGAARESLDHATLWLRENHPDPKLWEGWKVPRGWHAPRRAPELH